MRVWLGLTMALIALAGCSDEKAAAERAKLEAEQAAERRAETRLMSDLATAIPEVESRLQAWLKVENGLLFVVERTGEASFSLHALPITTPWHVTCNSEELEVTIGNWESSRYRDAGLFTSSISFANFSEQNCKALATAIGRKLLEMTGRGGAP